MKRVLFFVLCCTIVFTNAQNFVNQVLILNEGYFDYTTQQIVEPVSVGSFDPINQIYTEVLIIDSARFASDIIINGDYFYVAADNKILKYDLDNYILLEEIYLPGVRNLLISGDNLFVTRGEYMVTFDSYLHVYNKNDFSFIASFDTLTGPKWATQNMVVNGNVLYVAINNGFEWGNEKGIIGAIDINSLSYIDEIDLGPDGKNPDNMMIDNGMIYTVNNKDWTGMSISKFDILNTSLNTNNIASSSTGCGTSCIRSGEVNYQLSGDTSLYSWDGLNSTLTTGINKSFYTLATDEINNLLYASSTDYFSFGNIYVYDDNNALVSSFSCGVSPGTIVFDLRPINTSIFEDLHDPSIQDNKVYDFSGRLLGNNIPNKAGLYLRGGKKVFFVK